MTARMLQRPLYGGVFGEGDYSLATLPTIVNGLHGVRYLVIDPRGGAVLSVALDKGDAIESARTLLRLTTPPETSANDGLWEQGALWADLPFDDRRPPPRVSRRRREVFERSSGRCHYCQATLTLDGRWHVEHMVPRALGGDEAPGNLVAACPPCNQRKSDRTALEFVVSPGRDPSP